MNKRKYPGQLVKGEQLKPLYAAAYAAFFTQYGYYPRKNIQAIISNLWDEKHPETEEEYLAFYRNEPIVSEELAWWYTLNGCERVRRPLFVGAAMADLGYTSFAEFGCGLGVDALALVKQGYTATWLGDICVPNMTLARLLWKEQQEEAPVVDLVGQTVAALPAADVLYTSDVLEHLYDPERTVRPWLRQYKAVIVYAPFAQREKHHQHTTYRRDRFVGFMSLMGYEKLVYEMAFPPMVFLRKEL